MYRKNLIFLGIIIGLVCFCWTQPNNLYTESRTQQVGLFSFSSELISQTIMESADTEEDYDARDQFNQPISKPEVKKSLKVLFVSNLYDLLSKSEIYSIAKSIEILYAKFNLLASSITKTFRIIVQQVFAISCLSQLKKLFGICLSLFLSAFIVSTSLVPLLKFSFTPLSKAAPLVMRC